MCFELKGQFNQTKKRHNDRKTERQINKQRVKLSERVIDRKIYRHRNREIVVILIIINLIYRFEAA